jgi:hypothetical protein
VNVIDRLLEVITDTDFLRPSEDFVSCGLVMLSLAISRLSVEEREETLRTLEGGMLRQAVQQFLPEHPDVLPKKANGNGHAAH